VPQALHVTIFWTPWRKDSYQMNQEFPVFKVYHTLLLRVDFSPFLLSYGLLTLFSGPEEMKPSAPKYSKNSFLDDAKLAVARLPVCG
jgi:hypothetical protein